VKKATNKVVEIEATPRASGTGFLLKWPQGLRLMARPSRSPFPVFLQTQLSSILLQPLRHAFLSTLQQLSLAAWVRAPEARLSSHRRFAPVVRSSAFPLGGRGRAWCPERMH
jgi:hypothetical protein